MHNCTSTITCKCGGVVKWKHYMQSTQTTQTYNNQTSLYLKTYHYCICVVNKLHRKVQLSSHGSSEHLRNRAICFCVVCFGYKREKT